MAKAMKKKEEKKVEEPGEKMSPREEERLALIKSQPDDKILGKIWDTFADEILDHSQGLKEVMSHSINGALALGAKVIAFTEKPEVQKQLELANHDKKGMPWKDYNWVASYLCEAYSGMPTAKHLGDCARGYVKAVETGQLKGATLRSILGWVPSAVPALTGKNPLDEVNPASILPAPPKDPKDPKDKKDDAEIDARAELITALHDANESIQYFVDKVKEEGKSTEIKDIQANVSNLMATLETI